MQRRERLMVNVGSFVITIIMPRPVSACQRMAKSVTLEPGVNSYEAGADDCGHPRTMVELMLNDSPGV